MHRPHRLLDLTKFEDYERLGNESTPPLDRVVEALGALIDHRSDELLRVGMFRIEDAMPVRVCTFRARDPAKTRLFVLGCDDGELILGRCDALPAGDNLGATTLPPTWRRCRLDDFDEQIDQIVTMVVSRWLRPLGDRLDLWLVVRRWGRGGKRRDRCYHALVGIEDGELLLTAAMDDRRSRRSGRRIGPQAITADFPRWLTEDHFVAAVGQDPFAVREAGPSQRGRDDKQLGALTAQIMQTLDPSERSVELDRQELDSSELMPTENTTDVRRTCTGWSSRHLVYGDACGNVVIHAHTGGSDTRLVLGAPITTLALWEDAGVCRVVAGAMDHTLTGCVAEGSGWIEWVQPVLDQPTAVAWLPTVASRVELLVGFRDGHVKTVAWVGQARVGNVWSRLVGHLVRGIDRTEPELLVERVERLLEDQRRSKAPARVRIARCRALLLAFTELLGQAVSRWMPDEAARDRIARLFLPVPSGHVPVDALLHLLRITSKQRHSRGLSSLAYIIYGRAPLSVREEADVWLRAHGEQGGPMDEPDWPALVGRSKNSRQALAGSPKVSPTLKAVLTIEAWANAYVAAHTFALSFPTERGSSDIPRSAVVAVAPGGMDERAAEQPWTAIGRPTRVGLHRVHLGEEAGRDTCDVETAPGCEWPLKEPKKGDVLIDLLAVPYRERMCAVVAWRSGKIEIIDPHLGEAAPAECVSAWSEADRPVMLAALDDRLFIGAREGRYSRVWVRPLAPGAPNRSIDLGPLPRLSLIAVARRRGGPGTPRGYWLLVASAARASPRLVMLDADGGRVGEFGLRTLCSPVTAAAFDDPIKPTRLVIATRDGMVVAEDLDDPGLGIGRLPPTPCWVYRTIGSPRSVVRVGDTRPGFLVGTTHGRLTLLDADDGRRRWNHRLPAGLRNLAVSPSEGRGRFVLASQDDGRVAVLDHCPPVSFDTLADHVGKTARDDLSAPLDDADQAGVRVFRELAERHGTPAALAKVVEVLTDTGAHREVRARVVRYLAFEASPEPDLPLKRRLVVAMTFREHQLLLALLPAEGRAAWLEVIRLELARPVSDRSGDRGHDAHRAAVATWLALAPKPEIRTRRGRWLSSSFDQLPPTEHYDERWVRIEVARIIIDGLQRGRTSPATRLSLLLDALARVPLSVAAAARALLPVDAPLHAVMAMVHQLHESLHHEGMHDGAGRVAIDFLAWVFEVVREADDIVEGADLFAWLAAFHSRLAGADAGSWPARRASVFEALHAVGRRIRTAGERPAPIEELVVGLERLLPADLPFHQARVEDRRRWLDELRRAVTPRKSSAADERGDDWASLVAGLLRWTRRRLQRLADYEESYLRDTVRPHLTLRRGVVGPFGRVDVIIDAVGEGSVRLEDVEVTVWVAHDEAGLQTSDVAVRQSHHYAHYPTQHTRETYHFRGTLHPGARALIIHAEIEGRRPQDDADWYRHTERWRFELEVEATSVHRAPLPHALPRLFDHLMARLLAPHDAVVVLVTSPALSGAGADASIERARPRDGFARALVEHHGAAWLDLDRDTWQGGLLHSGLEALRARRTGRLNVIEADRWLEAHLGPAHGRVLRNWLDTLADLAASKPTDGTRVVWVLAEAHARALRHAGSQAFERLPRVEVYRLASGEPHEPPPEVREEFNAWQNRELAPLPSASRPRGAMRFDLRFFLDWRLWAYPDDESEVPAAVHRFERAHARAIGDLRALPRLQRAVAQAIARSRIHAETPFGILAPDQVLASRARWPGRGGRWVSRARDHVLRALDIQQVREASEPPLIRIEGFARVTGLESSRSRLPRVLLDWPRRDHAALEAAFAGLVHEGLAEYGGAVLRLRSPYREVIADLYAEHEQVAESARDQAVYAAIHGPDRSLIECVPMAVACDMGAEAQAVLLPAIPASERAALLELARYVDGERAPEGIEALLSAVFGRTIHPVEEGASWPDHLLIGLDSVRFFGLGPRLTDGAHSEYIGWVPDPPRIDGRRIGRAVNTLTMGIARRNRGNGRTPRLMLIGPGVERMAPDPRRRFAALGLEDIRWACLQSELSAGLRRRARSQMKLTFFSPFKVAGALPPGSNLFVGRHDEFEYIKERIHRQSCLIVGSRRIGKTTLLNQVRHWLESEELVRDGRRLVPLAVDCINVHSQSQLIEALAHALPPDVRFVVEGVHQASFDSLKAVVSWMRGRRMLPIFLLNEIDDISMKDNDFIATLKAHDDAGDARFVLVAYASALNVRRVRKPLFNFTGGLHYGERATCLTELTVEAAEELLGLLEEPPLSLTWRTEEERRSGLEHLIHRSYRIPWVLQSFGDRLVRRLEDAGRDVITDDDVRHVLREGGSLYREYFEQIDFKSLGFAKATDAHSAGMKLVLYALARDRYFLGGSAVRRADLASRDPLEFGFTVGEARAIVTASIGRLLSAAQRLRVSRWFEVLDLDEALRLLTLTLALVPDPLKSDRYAFLLHALPLELERSYGKDDPLLANLFVDTAVEFLQNLPGED